MIEQVRSDLYRMEIPLPRNPLRALNSYLFKGDGRSLIVDTGMNREECLKEMEADLKTLKVDLSKTDFFITHLHADHMGLAGTLPTSTSRVFFSRKEAAVPSSEARWQVICRFFQSNGFPEKEVQESLHNHPGHRFGPKKRPEFSIVDEGDRVDIGDYRFRCVETPGHSPGHMCLYDSEKKLLLSGDHILFDITPNISIWLEMSDSLGNYLVSLEKTRALEVASILPGHRSLWNDHRKRIDELRQHHLDRLNEVLAALSGGEKTGYDLAPHVTWDVEYKTWDQFPVGQKWFAVGETVAHANYLEKRGFVKRRTGDGLILFSLADAGGPDHLSKLPS